MKIDLFFLRLEIKLNWNKYENMNRVINTITVLRMQ